MKEFDAVITGAGFSGLYMLKKVRDELGLSARVFEAADEVGGTWYWNSYPGARCDADSICYCFSFSKELCDEWAWSNTFAERSEILSYLKHVADRFDLRRDIQLSTRVTKATYDEQRQRWIVETDAGDKVSAQFLITALGCLSTPIFPDVPGRETFKGQSAHTGLWPKQGITFEGKRVGLIGTGSSGVQIAPLIAERAAHLTLFQRTPAYSIPCRARPLSAEEQQQIRADYSAMWERVANSRGGFPWEMIEERSAFSVSEQERTAIYRQLWEEGGMRFLFNAFSDLMLDPKANETACQFLRGKIREIVKDPLVAEKLCPKYPFGTKRPTTNIGYYEMFNRDNISLVDLREEPIREVTEHGIRTGDRHHDLDVIVYATGFDAITGSLLRIDIRGVGGITLEEKWAQGARTFLGVGVAGFPNLFTIQGPQSPNVMSNAPVSVEQHVNWFGKCIEYMREKGYSTIEPTEQAEAGWGAVTNLMFGAMVPNEEGGYASGSNVPGKPRVFLSFLGGVGMYHQHCAEIAAKSYQGFVLR